MTINWTLVVVLAILAVSALVGYVKGLVKVLFSMLFMIVVFLTASLLTPRVTPVLKEKTDWYQQIYEGTGAYLESANILTGSADLTGLLGTSEDGNTHTLVPDALIAQISTSANEYLQSGMDAYREYVVTSISNAIFTALVYLGIMILTAILLLIVWAILNAVAKLPGIRVINRFGGLALGLAWGLALVWVGFTVISVFFHNELGLTIGTEINGNAFLSFLYDKNPILLLLLQYI